MAKVKTNKQLDAEYDAQVKDRERFDKVHDAAQRKAIRDSGIKTVEAARGTARKQNSRFDDKKLPR